ncbi:hypothetical protein BJV82DRAFT_505194 [Fennellomyces sp. T-0311]|nr:hypothetical protein BJV82DRAFT_505194 [Fennellomyces sp. T-0311]
MTADQTVDELPLSPVLQDNDVQEPALSESLADDLPAQRPSSDSSSASPRSSSTFGSKNETTTPSSPPFSSSSTCNDTIELNNHSGIGPWSNKKTKKYAKGVCGLTNLGNTCYMNSALQCMSNTPQLSKYFLSGKYKDELNRDNPLGMKGEVAEAYGEVIEELWSGTESSIAPRHFKLTIGRFNPSFVGYMQHDSQELLAFLLDGLHEDLNRILKKPYKEVDDDDTLPDKEIAERSWAYHKQRNDSVIVDLFQGQFKSRLECSECHKVSVTFDPFMYLSLPVPGQKQTKTKVVYVPYDPSQRPQRITITTGKAAKIAELRDQVAKWNNVKDPSTLLVLEIFNDKVYRVFSNDDSVSEIGTSDIIYVYQLPGTVPKASSNRRMNGGYTLAGGRIQSDDEEKPEWIVFPVYCETTPAEDDESRYKTPRQFGGPMILAIRPQDATLDNLYQLIAQHLERYTSMKLFEEVADSNAKKQESEAPQQQLIHTTAAVTAAGGRRMEPMPNLFTMKVIADDRHRNTSQLFPMGVTAWNSAKFRSLKERVVEEKEQREAFEREKKEAEERKLKEEEEKKQKEAEEQQSAKAESISDVSDAGDTAKTSTDSDDLDDDVVEDAAASFENNKVENGIIIRPPSPPKAKGKANGYRLGSAPTKPPPENVIRQGEGIILEWKVKKAEQIFGPATNSASSSSYSYNASDVDGTAWHDCEDRGDPLAPKEKTKKQLTLSDCLDEFTKEEMLSEEDLWYCPRCKDRKRATKKFDLWRMPEIVVVHLKRFSHTKTWRDKIDTLIDFPLEGLDLTERVLSIENSENIAPEDRLIYDLYGVDNHFGGMGGGHCK